MRGGSVTDGHAAREIPWLLSPHHSKVGVIQVSDRTWLVSFVHYELGYFDDRTSKLEPIDNPFAAKVLPMSSEKSATHDNGIDPD